MGKVISLLNQKGGVAKTTSCINLAESISRLGKTVLVIDMDPQANSSKGINLFTKQDTIYDILVKEVSVYRCVRKTHYGFHIVPSWIKLANANLEIAAIMGRETILKEAIEGLDYDYVLIDCAPSLELLTLNSLTASTDVLIPLNSSEFALDGIEDLLTTFKLVKRKLNSKLDIIGVLLTQVDDRTKLSAEYLNDVKELFKDKVFKTAIHNSVDIPKAQRERVPVRYFNEKSRASIEYLNVAKELIERG